MRYAFLLMPPTLLLTGCFLPLDEDASDPTAEPDNESFDEVNRLVTATRDDNMGLGNPSNAVADTAQPNNYLMTRPQHSLSYNDSKGTANWVSWHLSSAWKGGTPRSPSFKPDSRLPSGWTRVATSWYTNGGFDRGHLCPSDDRDGSAEDNKATFLMTNIVPQAPRNNQETWKHLEDYARTLIGAGKELYIIAGPTGMGGSGSRGGTTNTIHSGDVTVPAYVWKVIVVLPVGSDDVSRVTTSTRVIAVMMPNRQSVNSRPWGDYRVDVDSIEAATGYDFLSNVPASVQSVIESTVDSGPAP
jgi:endonuclease G, mitochondrial